MLAANDRSSLGVSTGDLALALGMKVYQHQNCVQAWAEFSPIHLHELLNSVKNKVLDFSLALWKEYPEAGESVVQEDKPKEAVVTHIFNTTVYGGAANLVGSAHHSTIQFGFAPGNFAALREVLLENGVDEADVEELRQAVKTDVPQAGKGFGPRVSAWMSKMFGKAASGAWGIGISGAGGLLAQALSKFYGL